jgi:hypothetical protein
MQRMLGKHTSSHLSVRITHILMMNLSATNIHERDSMTMVITIKAWSWFALPFAGTGPLGGKAFEDGAMPAVELPLGKRVFRALGISRRMN